MAVVTKNVITQILQRLYYLIFTLAGNNMPFLRKRSSSLPRILPPILDRDLDDEESQELYDGMHEAGGGRLAAFKQMDQTSNLIVREMQKFVCRFATEVSQVLPLPLPANSRQQRIGGCKMVIIESMLKCIQNNDDRMNVALEFVFFTRVQF